MVIQPVVLSLFYWGKRKFLAFNLKRVTTYQSYLGALGVKYRIYGAYFDT